MIYPSIDDLLKKIESKYLLVNVASRRAREMDETGYFQMKESEYKSSKNIGRALEEINRGLIKIKSVSESQE
ncbi:MAG: DNA-directed RNA polymerase subunit omega [Bacilli bacterium]|nr:DNA-directed RNA polymerase subunit omega [Bacilli bacterium]